MSRKMQLKVIVAGVLALTVIGVTALAVGLDRWDVQTQYDQPIYYGAGFVIFMLVQAVTRLARK